MGGWLALLLARELKKRNGAPPIAGMVLIAPAVDFTEELMWKNFSAAIKREIEEKGVWRRPSQYSEGPYPITRSLIEDGRKHLLLGGLIETGCPVHILQGVQDPDVPWRHAVELVSRFARDDVVLTLIKDGDHRLSRPEDIERLLAAIAGILGRARRPTRHVRCRRSPIAVFSNAANFSRGSRRDSAHTAAPRTSGEASSSKRSASCASDASPELPMAMRTLRTKRSRPVRLIEVLANSARNCASSSRASSASAGARNVSRAASLASRPCTANLFHGHTAKQSSQP